MMVREMDDATRNLVRFLQRNNSVAQYARVLTAAISVSSEPIFSNAASYASERRKRSDLYLANAIAVFWDLLRGYRCSLEDFERAKRFFSQHEGEKGHWTTYFFLASASAAYTSLAQVRGECIQDMEVVFARTVEVMVKLGAPCDERLVKHLRRYNTNLVQGYFSGLVDSCRLTANPRAARLMFMQYTARIGVSTVAGMKIHRLRLAVDLPRRFSNLLGLA